MIWRYTIILEKVNVVVDALSRKSYAKEVQVAARSSELCAEFEQLNLGFVTNAVELVIEPTLEQEIRKGQLLNLKLKDYVCLKIRLYEVKFFMRYMSPLTLFTLGIPRY